jgi:hypothetical protein
VFDDVFSVIDQRVVGGGHSKLTLARGGERYDAMLFRHADPLPASIHAAYRPEMNEWNGFFVAARRRALAAGLIPRGCSAPETLRPTLVHRAVLSPTARAR